MTLATGPGHDNARSVFDTQTVCLGLCSLSENAASDFQTQVTGGLVDAGARGRTLPPRNLPWALFSAVVSGGGRFLRAQFGEEFCEFVVGGVPE